MKFGSWTFEGKTLVYKFQESFNSIILTDYMKNGAWDIIDGPGNIITVNDSITGQVRIGLLCVCCRLPNTTFNVF